MVRAKRLFDWEYGLHLMTGGAWLRPRIDTDPVAMMRQIAMSEVAAGAPFVTGCS
jgi:hypothetical protein